jgi:hypothetical protein
MFGKKKERTVDQDYATSSKNMDIIYMRSVNDPYRTDEIGGLVESEDKDDFNDLSAYINKHEQNQTYVFTKNHNIYSAVVISGYYSGAKNAQEYKDTKTPSLDFSIKIEGVRNNNIFANVRIQKGGYDSIFINDICSFIKDFNRSTTGYRQNMPRVVWSPYDADCSLDDWMNSTATNITDGHYPEEQKEFNRQADVMIHHMQTLLDKSKTILLDASVIEQLLDHAKTVRDSYLELTDTVESHTDYHEFLDLIVKDMEQADYTWVTIQRSELEKAQDSIIRKTNEFNAVIQSVSNTME